MGLNAAVPCDTLSLGCRHEPGGTRQCSLVLDLHASPILYMQSPLLTLCDKTQCAKSTYKTLHPSPWVHVHDAMSKLSACTVAQKGILECDNASAKLHVTKVRHLLQLLPRGTRSCCATGSLYVTIFQRTDDVTETVPASSYTFSTRDTVAFASSS